MRKTLTTSTWQGAHRIANTKPNRAKWGNFVIDHPLNIAIVCSLKCNQVCNIGYDEGACLRLVQRIAKRELMKVPGGRRMSEKLAGLFLAFFFTGAVFMIRQEMKNQEQKAKGRGNFTEIADLKKQTRINAQDVDF